MHFCTLIITEIPADIISNHGKIKAFLNPGTRNASVRAWVAVIALFVAISGGFVRKL